MNPDPFTDDVKHEELLFNEPKYLQGWQAGLAHVVDNTHLTDKIDKLEQQAQLNNACVDRLKAKIEELETPWYIKLWNKMPKVSLKVERRNNR